MDRKLEETPGQSNTRLRGRVDLLEEALDGISSAGVEAEGQDQRRDRRTRRLEEAVADLYEAQAGMEQSCRILASASLKSKRALADVAADLATLSRE